MSTFDDITQFNRQIGDLIAQSGIAGARLKAALRGVVATYWPDMPGYSTLDHPVVEEVRKASVGVGVALTFKEHGIQKVVMLEAGANYPEVANGPLYMIPGGFINLTRTEGSSLVTPLDRPESPRSGAAREVEEELKLPDGTPLLRIDPARLKPMDVDTLAVRGGATMVVGMMMELNPQEVAAVKAHVAQIAADPAYRLAVAQQSKNPHSGQPEVASVTIVPLKELAEGKYPMLHEDQQSLFDQLQLHFSNGPSRSI